MAAPAPTTPPKNGAAKTEETEKAPVTDAPAAGGLKSWLPLIVTIVAMPALAYATTMFVLLPKLQKAVGSAATAGESSGEKPGHSGEGKESAEGKAGGETKHGERINGKTNLPFGKVLVNISGTLGMRYLLTSFTLVGGDPEFKGKIEQNKDRLMDLAMSTLSTKTIADLEKPGARNMIRSELISAFNGALGQGYVQEIYFTEFAIQ